MSMKESAGPPTTRCRRDGAGLEAVSYYDPPNMTYPFGAYICVMNIDVDTGVYKIRRFYALDDCGTRINPMIIEGQCMAG
jgi:carbon-monoxide dehydrogenase large subunit